MDVSRTIIETDGTTLELSGEVLRISASAAGVGLDGGGGSALTVDVDDTTIGIVNIDQIGLKSGGIRNAHVSSTAAIDRPKLGINSGASHYSSASKTTNSTTYVTINSGAITMGFSAYKYKIGITNMDSTNESYLKLSRASSAGNSYVVFKTTVGATSHYTRLGMYLGVGEECYFPLPMDLITSDRASQDIVISSTTISFEWKVDHANTTAELVRSRGQIWNA